MCVLYNFARVCFKKKRNYKRRSKQCIGNQWRIQTSPIPRQNAHMTHQKRKEKNKINKLMIK